MARRFAICSEGEAIAYLAHDILGPRLVECTRLVMAASEKPIKDILASPDDLKFRSSMTLFDAISHKEIFVEAMGTFYPDGKLSGRQGSRTALSRITLGPSWSCPSST